MWRVRAKSGGMTARDGFLIVGLSWIAMSLFGALLFVLTGDIPNYVDALFETISGLTTTGASVVTAPEEMTRGGMFWRLFTHWIGGMGILVFVLAVLPMSGNRSMHIMRAEVPGRRSASSCRASARPPPSSTCCTSRSRSWRWFCSSPAA